jgi:integrative and conjugative element protein (TIGR02256 family)
MRDIEFWSRDRQFGLVIPQRKMSRILRICCETIPVETGGILVGSYTDDLTCALVTDVSKAPLDSTSGKTWFNRGILGLQLWLDRLWHSKRFYLGEWHFHPYARPNPSHIDIKQMEKISHASKYNCPEPILIIVGGDPNDSWQTSAHVFPKNRESVELFGEASVNWLIDAKSKMKN